MNELRCNQISLYLSLIWQHCE